MTIILKNELRARNIITPWEEKRQRYGLSYGADPVGYDITVREELVLTAGKTTLCSSEQHVNMPLDVIAFTQSKSSLVRQGIMPLMAPLDPGFRGYITLEIAWLPLADDLSHPRRLIFLPGMPIARLVFHRLSEPVEPYTGKYQDQGPRAIPAIGCTSDPCYA